MKGQDKTLQKQLNKVEIRQPSRKRIQKNDSEDDPGSQKKNGGKGWEDAKNVYQTPEERKNKQKWKTNKQTNKPLEGINSRITEAEEQISDLEDRMVEINSAEQKFFFLS